jgi:ubiquinone/menaquinone biosynthesis C-methylase UbiE
MKESDATFRNATSASASAYDRIHFLMISLVHDKLYRLFVNPYRPLYAAGIKPKQRVLEIGCGPGFFTIPAAKIAGKGGCVFALDINPVAVEAVRRKVKENSLTNVKVILAYTSKWGLEDNSFDLAFLFGVLHDFSDVAAVMREMHRVLKANGILSVQRSSSSERMLMDVITKDSLFVFKEKIDGIFKFSKSGK